MERLGLERLRALGVPAGRHRLSGGASGSIVWNRIRATMLGHRVDVRATRSSAHGAAMLAALGSGDRTLEQVCTDLAHASATVDPVTEQVSALDDRYRVFTDRLAQRGLHP